MLIDKVLRNRMGVDPQRLEKLTQCQVFQASREVARDAYNAVVDQHQSKKLNPGEHIAHRIEMPFRSCWIEVDRYFINAAHEITQFNLDLVGIFLQEDIVENQLSLQAGVLVARKEISTETVHAVAYIYYNMGNGKSVSSDKWLIADKENTQQMKVLGIEDTLENRKIMASLAYLATAWAARIFETINNYAMAEDDDAKLYYNFRSGKRRVQGKINKIIYIRPKQEREHKLPSGKTLQCGYRFSVRGHWRKVNGIGKDKMGNYNVIGLTWVTDFIKGEKHLPYIAKTRKVTD